MLVINLSAVSPAVAAPEKKTPQIAGKIAAMPAGALIQVTLKTGAGGNKTIRDAWARFPGRVST